MTLHLCITGASAGIGEACARRMASVPGGVRLFLGARRIDRLDALAKSLTAKPQIEVAFAPLDLRSDDSIQEFAKAALAALGRIDVLINNGGGAHGVGTVADGNLADWQAMMETNFLGTARLTQAFLPTFLAQKSGHILNIGSIAGLSVYEGGAVYCASKHALQALTKTLKLELNGKGIRVTSIDPGMVETEFSEVRFKGDKQKAKNVYAGLKPLSAVDIAESVHYALTCPPHVNIDQIVLTPLAQASVYKVHREL